MRCGAQMNQENVQTLFDTVARILSRDSGGIKE